MIRVGIAGWSYEDWRGIVYPVRKPARLDRLAYLADYFNAIEINSSFYRIPEPGVVASWCRRVEGRPDFRFTVKLYQGFTHRKEELKESEEPAFKKALEPLVDAGLLGAVLVQFPYSFHPVPENLGRLEKLVGAFKEYPLIVEVRGDEWDTKEFFDFLRARKVGFCNIDQPALSRCLRPTEVATSKVGYVRLHGRNAKNWFTGGAKPSTRYDYLYSEEELVPWVDRIRRIAEQAVDVFIIANNHYRGKGPLAALTLLSMLTGRPVEAPPDLVAAYPQIAPRVVPQIPAQGRLFRD